MCVGCRCGYATHPAPLLWCWWITKQLASTRAPARVATPTHDWWKTQSIALLRVGCDRPQPRFEWGDSPLVTRIKKGDMAAGRFAQWPSRAWCNVSYTRKRSCSHQSDPTSSVHASCCDDAPGPTPLPLLPQHPTPPHVGVSVSVPHANSMLVTVRALPRNVRASADTPRQNCHCGCAVRTASCSTLLRATRDATARAGHRHGSGHGHAPHHHHWRRDTAAAGHCRPRTAAMRERATAHAPSVKRCCCCTRRAERSAAIAGRHSPRRERRWQVLAARVRRWGGRCRHSVVSCRHHSR